MIVANAKRPRRKADVLRRDPSRTAGIRGAWSAEVSRRFKGFWSAIYQFLVTDDELGLAPDEPARLKGFDQFTANKGKFAFATDDAKLDEFKAWFSQQVDSELLSPETPGGEPWNAKYVRSAYRTGVVRAYTDAHKEALAKGADFFDGSKAEFLRQSFDTSEAVSKVRLLYTRSFDQLKGVTADMGQKMSRIMAESIANGINPRETARRLKKEVVELGEKRALVIARTETIYAHAEGQLDSFEAMGLEEVGLKAEWITATGACPFCVEAARRNPYKLADARGLIPLHPNCRCTWGPFMSEFAEAGPKVKAQEELSKKANAAKKAKAEKTKALKKARLEKKAIREKAKARQEAKEAARAAKAEKIKAEEKAKAEKEKLEKKAADLKKAQAAKKAKDLQNQLELAATPVPETPAEIKAAIKKLKTAKPVNEDAGAAIGKKLTELDEALGPAVAKEQQAAAAAKVKAEVRAAEETGKLPTVADLDRIRPLPGSTRPDLMENRVTGKKWVMKSTTAGVKPDHLRSEALADELYRKIGMNVPRSGIVETAEGPVKLSEFLDDGKTLGDWLKGKSAAEQAQMFRQIGDGFTADALLGNWDVVGLNLDNVLVVKGTAYRIDNGGALLYRAQGAPKHNFGAVVDELTTLRDPAVNSQTARVFGHLTEDDINAQIETLLKKRDEVLDAVSDTSLRKTLAARFDWLEARVRPPKSAPPAVKGGYKARAGARLPEPGILPDTAERVRESRVNGVTILGDREDVEDLTILAWGEEAKDGSKVTKLQLKVTEAGSAKITEKLDPDILWAVRRRASDNASGVMPNDVYWGPIQAAAKTVAAHAGDGKYNETTILKMQQYANTLKSGFAGDTSDAVAMKEYYLDAVDKILKAKEARQPPPFITQFVKPAPTQAEAATGGTLQAEVRPLSFNTSELKNGRARRTNALNIAGDADMLEIDAGDGVKIHFHERGSWEEQKKIMLGKARSDGIQGFTFQGVVQVTVPGEVSTDTLRAAAAKLKAIGIDTTPPTPEYQELLYLHRSVNLRKDADLAEYRAIFDADIPDAEKVAKIKDWAGKRYGVSFDDPKSYNPAGSTDGFGNGYVHWTRWDLTPETLEKEMGEYVLSHRTDYLETALEGFLNSGGLLTSTSQRIRKGVPVGSTGGKSSAADLTTGGADYFFTRIARRNDNLGQFRFKIGTLARQDAISYSTDQFGNVSRIDKRLSDIEKYKKAAQHSDNETLLKYSVSLLDDLDHIQVKSKAEREAVLKIFRKHKVEKLNDGRPIEDVVRLK